MPKIREDIIYYLSRSMIERIDWCKNNFEKSSTTKASEHIASGHSRSTIGTFDDIENNHDVYIGEACMKKFYEYLREHAMKIIYVKKKKIMPRNETILECMITFINLQIVKNLIIQPIVC